MGRGGSRRVDRRRVLQCPRASVRSAELAAGRRGIAQLQAESAAQTRELARLNEAFAILNQPEAKQVVFGGAAPQPPRGRVFLDPMRGVLLLASNLPPAPAGKIYEMWVIPKGGQPPGARGLVPVLRGRDRHARAAGARGCGRHCRRGGYGGGGGWRARYRICRPSSAAL